jgi:hypothetical protein
MEYRQAYTSTQACQGLDELRTQIHTSQGPDSRLWTILSAPMVHGTVSAQNSVACMYGVPCTSKGVNNNARKALVTHLRSWKNFEESWNGML